MLITEHFDDNSHPSSTLGVGVGVAGGDILF